jgi:hypothetical protein
MNVTGIICSLFFLTAIIVKGFSMIFFEKIIPLLKLSQGQKVKVNEKQLKQIRFITADKNLKLNLDYFFRAIRVSKIALGAIFLTFILNWIFGDSNC